SIACDRVFIFFTVHETRRTHGTRLGELAFTDSPVNRTAACAALLTLFAACGAPQRLKVPAAASRRLVVADASEPGSVPAVATSKYFAGRRRGAAGGAAVAPVQSRSLTASGGSDAALPLHRSAQTRGGIDMKRIVMSLTLAIASLIVPGFAFAEEHECSVATLYGDYLFTGRADAPMYEHIATFPRVFAGVYTFDGEGNMSGVASQSRGGVTVTKIPVSATYTLDSECMGTLTFHPVPPATDEQHFDIFIAQDGQEGNFIRVDAG